MDRVDGQTADVVVIGGGAAGLSGALMLARARRSVVVIDAGAPRNAPAEGVHGLLARDGTPPGRAAGAGPGGGPAVRRPGRGRRGRRGRPRRRRVRRDAGRRPIGPGAAAAGDHRPGRRAARRGRACASGGAATCCTARTATAGRSATGPSACSRAGRCRCTRRCCSGSGPPTSPSSPTPLPAPTAGAGRAARGARHQGRRRRGGRGRGRRRPADGCPAARRPGRPPRRAWWSRRGWSRGPALLAGLGLRAVEHPSGVGEYVPADPTGRTDVPGVWVAGNVTDLTAQVGGRGGGRRDGGGADQRRPGHGGDRSAAVAAYREPFSAESEARLCAAVAGAGATVSDAVAGRPMSGSVGRGTCEGTPPCRGSCCAWRRSSGCSCWRASPSASWSGSCRACSVSR